MTFDDIGRVGNIMDMSASRFLCILICQLRAFTAAQQAIGNDVVDDAAVDQDSDTSAVDGADNEVTSPVSDNVASDNVGTSAGTEDSFNSQNSDKQSAETDGQSEDVNPSEEETLVDDDDNLAEEGEGEQIDSADEVSTPAISDVPDISSTAGSPILLTDLPTIAGVGVPSQVVPFTASAPFMQKSQLPEGTVFICVGALLGFLGCCVLVWRGMVAWSLHRSVKKAAASYSGNSSSKSMMLRPPGGKSFYGAGPGSSVSLDKLSGMKSGGRTDSYCNRSPVVQADRRSLFFSPTAGAGLNAANTASRSSTYLPVAVTSGTNTSMTDIACNGGGNNNSPGSGLPTSPHSHVLNSFSYHNTHVQGYQHALSISNTPTISPNMSPSRRDGHDSVKSENKNHNYSEKSVTSSALTPLRPKLGRTPSAYLDDMFDNYGVVVDGDIVRER